MAPRKKPNPQIRISGNWLKLFLKTNMVAPLVKENKIGKDMSLKKAENEKEEALKE